MSKTVIGLMDNIAEAQNVVRELVASGIDRDDIGFMAAPAPARRSAASRGSRSRSRRLRFPASA